MAEHDPGTSSHPPWCTCDHEGDGPHRSEAVVVPVILADRRVDAGRPDARGTEIVIQRFRHAGDPRDWILLEEAEVGSVSPIMLSLETARVLAAALRLVSRQPG